MSKSNFTRRGVLKTGAVAGAGLATPTLFTGNVWAEAHSGFTNAPTGDTVTLGFNVPQTGAYADEGADELRRRGPRVDLPLCGRELRRSDRPQRGLGVTLRARRSLSS